MCINNINFQRLDTSPIKSFTNTANGQIEVTKHIVNVVLFNDNKSMWYARLNHTVQSMQSNCDNAYFKRQRSITKNRSRAKSLSKPF